MGHSRRKALTAGLALAFAAPAAGFAASAAEPDAELVALCGAFDVLEEAGEGTDDAGRDRLADQKGVLLERIVALPCLTAAGVYALGRSLAGFVGEAELADDFKPFAENRLLAAMLRGITRGQGGVTVLASAPPAPATEAVSDAGLLRACSEYIALDRQLIAIGAEQGDLLSCDPIWKTLDRKSRVLVSKRHRLEERISDMPARTPEGIRAKAEATQHMLSSDADGGDGPMSHEAAMAWSLVEDLLRAA